MTSVGQLVAGQGSFEARNLKMTLFWFFVVLTLKRVQKWIWTLKMTSKFHCKNQQHI